VAHRSAGPDSGPPVDLAELYAEVCSWFRRDALFSVLETQKTEIETISLDWLARSGRRWRPLLTVSVCEGLHEGGPREARETIRRLALAVECLHKAMLIYDDLQDGRGQHSGRPALHEEHGVPVALTASLYLLGQGYRLITACGAPPEKRSQMLAWASQSQCELCLGHGHDLLRKKSGGGTGILACPAVSAPPYPPLLRGGEQRRPELDLTAPEQALASSHRKTAASFEVGLRLAEIYTGGDEALRQTLKDYSMALGVAYRAHGGGWGLGSGDCNTNPTTGVVSPQSPVPSVSLSPDPRPQSPVPSVLPVPARTRTEESGAAVLARTKRAALDALSALKNARLRDVLTQATELILSEGLTPN